MLQAIANPIRKRRIVGIH